MLRSVALFTLICACVSSALASSCTSPSATVTSFSTLDATILTHLGHIGEFTLSCGNSAEPNLYAEFPCGAVVPVAHIGKNKYQVSWIDEIKGSSGGNIVVRLFDDEGYANLRKAQRDGDKVSGVKSLLDITVPTTSAYKGPWLNAEILAELLVVAIAYFAFSTKSKVQA